MRSIIRNFKKFCSINEKQLQLTPHQLWLTEGKGNERSFTGEYWFVKDVGTYHCVKCESSLFESNYKMQLPNGMATFWSHILEKVEVIEEKEEQFSDNTNIDVKKYLDNKTNQRCQCSNCKAHLGLVFMDGPLPTLMRYNINSGSLIFKEKAWFTDPNVLKVQKKIKENKLGKLRAKSNKDNNLQFDEEKYNQVVEKSRLQQQK